MDEGEQQQIVKQFQDMQRMLQPLQIRNPFAESLKIPEEVFKPRRTNAHYLAFVELITFYHQYQRDKQYDKETTDESGQAGEEYIETTLEDIAEANKLMKEVLIGKSDELNGACRGYFESLKAWLQKEQRNKFTNREIRQVLRVNANNQKRYCRRCRSKMKKPMQKLSTC